MSLLDTTRRLLEQAAVVYRTTPYAADVTRLTERLDTPLRVAIAGKVKAGKSTLLNALVGEELAPTDAGECTKIITWYADGHTYEARLTPHGGESRQVPFVRDGGAIEVDLCGLEPEAVERLDIMWPSRRLATVTLIDTPGIGALSAAGERAWTFIRPDDEETPADAVLYLMKHLHAQDLQFLETFHDTSVSTPNPVTAIGVLSRADEVGGGRLDAMASANRIAGRYRTDDRIRRMVQTVVPVAGLIAETAATLTEDEFRALRIVADRSPKELDALLLSTDRFVERDGLALTEPERRRLLERFGVYGIRVAATLIRRDVVTNAGELADELRRRSGLEELVRLLNTLFVDRRDLLKSKSALHGLDALAAAAPVEGADELRREIEQVLAGAHEYAELQLVGAIRAGQVTAKPDVVEEMERLVGAAGQDRSARLGLEPGASDDMVHGAAHDAIARWRRRAENPLTNHDLRVASQVVIRTCEGMIAGANA